MIRPSLGSMMKPPLYTIIGSVKFRLPTADNAIVIDRAVATVNKIPSSSNVLIVFTL